ncbi:MAG TPA: BON domain-containing protein [Candidatus Angelobacter sp.]|nr:BON domain-containing protein [Candidatus Angelobacter sp.]
MRKLFCQGTLLLLSAGMALAQAASPQNSQSTTPTTPPTMPEQQKPANDSGKAQEQSPGTAAPSQQSNLPQSDVNATTDLQSKIQTAIQQDPSLSSSNINVNVTDRAVELRGTVASDTARQSAEQIAKANAGDRKVKNHLKVSSTDNTSTPPIPN